MVEDEAFVIFLRRVAMAVILRAINDLSSKKGSYRYNTARNFCLGTTKAWEDSRDIYCQLADIEPKKIRQEALRRINGAGTNII